MTNEILNECINAIHDVNATGFSFVDSLMRVLMKYNKELHIDNIVTVWRVSFSPDYTKEYRFYSNQQHFNIDSLDVVKLSERVSVISSEDNDFSKYRLSSELHNSHIVALPINHFIKDDSLLPTRGVMLLFSQFSILNITEQQLLLLHNLINKREPKTFTSRNVVNAFKMLLAKSKQDEISYVKCYKFIGDSLDTISNKRSKLFSNSGLRHYSLWQYKPGNRENFSLIKEFNRNTFKGSPHLITNTSLQKNDSHFLIDTIIDNIDNPVNQNMDATILKCISFNEAKGSFKEDSYFRDLELCDEDSTIIVVAVGKGTSCMVSCLYIKNIVYSVFISKELILHYNQEISRRVFEENNRTSNSILRSLMRASFNNKTESAFYSKASDILKRANEAEDCLIYMLNEKGKLVLKSEGDQEQFENGKKLLIPQRYLSDINFVNWLNKRELRNIVTKGYIDYYPVIEDNENQVRSAMAIQVSPNNQLCCLIILINKNFIPSSKCVFYHNTFIIDNYTITNFCGNFLVQYQRLQNSIRNRNYLLQKLRHEIPNNTSSIRNATRSIRERIEEPDIYARRNYIHVILNSIILSTNRIYLLAQFFSAVGFTQEKFAENRKRVSINHFLNSYIDIFRTEGSYRNVDVYFDLKDENPIIYVSDYYLLALVNIITNAIRYAAEGTSVYIEASRNRFVVTDIGIPIKQNEIDLIYNEGFRSDEAIAINEKGMGYGLYLSKMILESHDSEITAQCEKHSNENYYLQQAICEYVRGLETTKRGDFLYAGIDDFNRPTADNLFNHIEKNSNESLDKRFVNNNKDLMQKWLDYLNKYNLVFLDMENDFLTKEVYKVSFTVFIK